MNSNNDKINNETLIDDSERKNQSYNNENYNKNYNDYNEYNNDQNNHNEFSFKQFYNNLKNIETIVDFNLIAVVSIWLFLSFTFFSIF